MKRILSIILALILTIGIFPIMPGVANAAVERTQAEAVAWITAVENDGMVGNVNTSDGSLLQCVDLIHYYMDFWGIPRYSNNASEYVNIDLPDGWTYQSIPASGDIAVWDAGGWNEGTTGHVALVTDASTGGFSFVDINDKTGKISSTYTHSNAATFIRPYYSVPVAVSFKTWNNSKYTYIDSTKASIGQEITVSHGVANEMSVSLYDAAGNFLQEKSELWADHGEHIITYMDFDSLKPGTKYKYRFYVNVYGMYYMSDMQSFTTSDTQSDNSLVSPNIENKNRYTITFDANGGNTRSEILTLNTDGKTSISDNETVREGYKFLGWSENRNADKADYKLGDHFVLDRNITLYAVWEKEAVSSADSSPSDWAAIEVDAAIKAGLVPKNLQKNYTMPVYRLEVAGMFMSLIEEVSGKKIDTILKNNNVSRNENAFADTNDSNVLAANALGIINGVGNNLFDAYGTLTRGEITAIINRSANVLGIKTIGFTHSFTDVVNHWCNSELGWAAATGIINGVGNNRFAPDDKLTTEQAIAIAYRAYQKLKDINEGYMGYTPTHTMEENGHKYVLFNYEMSWTEAKDLCEDMGGHLATITTPLEAVVIGLLSTWGYADAHWLGGTSAGDADNQFRWITGEPFLYTDWYEGEPSHSEIDGETECYLEIRISYDGKWNDVANSNYSNKGFILEID